MDSPWPQLQRRGRVPVCPSHWPMRQRLRSNSPRRLHPLHPVTTQRLWTFAPICMDGRNRRSRLPPRAKRRTSMMVATIRSISPWAPANVATNRNPSWVTSRSRRCSSRRVRPRIPWLRPQPANFCPELIHILRPWQLPIFSELDNSPTGMARAIWWWIRSRKCPIL